MPLFFYRAIMQLVGLLAVFFGPLVLFCRKRRQSFFKRLFPGKGTSAPRSPVIWIHALSVGETFSVAPLVRGIRSDWPQAHLVCSASTASGVVACREQLGKVADEIRFFPYDVPFSVNAAISAVDPDLFVLVETDVWPNFMHALSARKVRALWVNARISERTASFWRRLAGLFRPTLASFAMIVPQSEFDGKRLAGLSISGDQVPFCGNLKFDRKGPDPERAALSWLKESLARTGRPVFIGGSTHEGEEAVLLEAAGTLRSTHPELMLILAPRDPDRAGHVAALALESGWKTVFWDDTDGPSDCVVIDRIGLLTDLYALGTLGFVGGSLVPIGGHNPLEPAAAGIPVLFGPFMTTVVDTVTELRRLEAGFEVTDAESMAACVTALLSDPEKRETAGARGRSFVVSNQGVGRRILDRIAHEVGPEAAS